MSNQRNVSALAAILCEADPHWRYLPDTGGLAQFLASRGVLVPAALTTQQALRLYNLGTMVVPTGFEMGPGPIVNELEGIARGE